MKNKASVSSRDVAKAAGVSQATVSYVLNNTPGVRIRPETRQAVLDAMTKLNYYPNHIARGMKLSKSMSIGVVTDRNATNFYFMKTLEGIKDGVQPHNYSITLMFNKPGKASDLEFIKYYGSYRLDGIIFAFASPEESTIEYMNDKGIPFVIVDAYSRGGSVNEVCTDHIDKIRQVVSHLTRTGITRIGYAGPASPSAADKRVEAFREALLELGIKINENHIVFSPFDDNEIKKVLTALLSDRKRPEAMIAGSPRFGLLAAKCAQMLNIRIPEKLRVVSLGSSNFYEIAHPSLSALEVPLYDMGLQSAKKLFGILNGEAADRSTVLPSELVVRDSS